jgi:predicted secreted hydrolase
LAKEQAGWDWMGLTLGDGSDLMLYRLRRRDGGTDYLSGTRVTPDGQPQYLSSGQIEMNGAKPWKSPATGGVYSQEWTVKVPGEPPLTVRSLMSGQELVTKASTDVSYFEGAVDVFGAEGKRAGEGYLEITGTSKPLTDGGMSDARK